MTRITIPIVNKSNNKLPSYLTAFSSGMNVCAFTDESIVIKPRTKRLIRTGLFVDIPNGFEIIIRLTKNTCKGGEIIFIDSPEFIEPEYHGEIQFIIANIGEQDFVVNNGDRIAQLVLQEVPKIQWYEEIELPSSYKITAGFGNTKL